LKDWLQRGQRWYSLRDIAHLFSPAAPLSAMFDYLRGSHPERLQNDFSKRDPEMMAWLAEGFAALGRIFRLRIHGIANVPASGPALLVGNHNGGVLTLDAIFTVAAILDHHGPERVVHPLVHDLILYDRVSRRFCEHTGLLRASHDSGMQALRTDDMVLVYPGSDFDSFRPWKDRHKIALNGRTGFVRLALRAGVPVIPVVSIGTHEQMVVLVRGDRLARALGLGRLLRAKVLPLTLALPFGLSLGFFPYLPLPAQTSIAFGRPIRWPELSPEAADDPTVLARCRDQVGAAMQEILDALADARRPFLGQPPARQAAIDALVSPRRP
jgi:1-acyl-sn-glycerol-3-phosphate acyltransferase